MKKKNRLNARRNGQSITGDEKCLFSLDCDLSLSAISTNVAHNREYGKNENDNGNVHASDYAHTHIRVEILLCVRSVSSIVYVCVCVSFSVSICTFSIDTQAHYTRIALSYTPT